MAAVSLTNSIPPVTLTPLVPTSVGVPGDGTLIGYINSNPPTSSNVLCNNLLTALIGTANTGAFGTPAQINALETTLLGVAKTHITLYYRTVIEVCRNGTDAQFQTKLQNKYDKIIAAQTLLSKIKIGANHELMKAVKKAKNDPKKLKKANTKLKELQNKIADSTSNVTKFTALKAAHAANADKCVTEAGDCLTPANLLLIKEDSGDYAKISRLLWPKVEEMEIDGDFSVRNDMFESQSPPEQCKFVTGDKKITDKCWICSKPLNMQKTEMPIECEHILSILPALKYLFLYQTKHSNQTAKFNAATLELIRQLLLFEYRNAHKCCNQAKSDINVIEMTAVTSNASSGLWQLNQEHITKIFDKIGGAGTSWGCNTIKGLSSALGPSATSANKTKRQNIRDDNLRTYAKQIIDYLKDQVTLFTSLCGGNAVKGKLVFKVFYICRFFYNIPISRMFCLLTGGPYPLTTTNINNEVIVPIKPRGIFLGGAKDIYGREIPDSKIIILPSLHQNLAFKDVEIERDIITPLISEAFNKVIQGIDATRFFLSSDITSGNKPDIPDGYLVLFRYFNGITSIDSPLYKTNIEYDDLSKLFDIYFVLPRQLFYKFKPNNNILDISNTDLSKIDDQKDASAFNGMIQYINNLKQDKFQNLLKDISINLNAYNVQLVNEFRIFMLENSAIIEEVKSYYTTTGDISEPSLIKINAYNKYMNFIKLGNPIIILYYQGLLTVDDLILIARYDIIGVIQAYYTPPGDDFADNPDIMLDGAVHVALEHANILVQEQPTMTPRLQQAIREASIISELTAEKFADKLIKLTESAAQDAASVSKSLIVKNMTYFFGEVLKLLNKEIFLLSDALLLQDGQLNPNFMNVYIETFIREILNTSENNYNYIITTIGKDKFELLCSSINNFMEFTDDGELDSRDLYFFLGQNAQNAQNAQDAQAAQAALDNFLSVQQNIQNKEDMDSIINDIFYNYDMFSAYFDLINPQLALNPEDLFYLHIQCFSVFFATEKQKYLDSHEAEYENMDKVDNYLANIIEMLKIIKSVEFNGENFPLTVDYNIYNFTTQIGCDVSNLKPENFIATSTNDDSVFPDNILVIISEAIMYNKKKYKVIEPIDQEFDAVVDANMRSVAMGTNLRVQIPSYGLQTDVYNTGSPTGIDMTRSMSGFEDFQSVDDNNSDTVNKNLRLRKGNTNMFERSRTKSDGDTLDNSQVLKKQKQTTINTRKQNKKEILNNRRGLGNNIREIEIGGTKKRKKKNRRKTIKKNKRHFSLGRKNKRKSLKKCKRL